MALKRVLIVIGSLRSGGTERQAVLTANQLCEQGIDVTMLLFDYRKGAAYALHPAVKIVAARGGVAGGSAVPAASGQPAAQHRCSYELSGCGERALRPCVLAFEPSGMESAQFQCIARLDQSKRVCPCALAVQTPGSRCDSG